MRLNSRLAEFSLRLEAGIPIGIKPKGDSGLKTE
jgi:hypothetical protein